MKIEWTNQAESRVYDIAKYIALDSITEAEKWVDNIQFGHQKGRHLV